MSANKLPVTFNFFKEHTYHEECMESLMKLKANGDQQMYERLLNNEEARETALRSYYEAFYLRPKIRERYHIRLKSVPKKIKEKLLSIPVQDTCAKNKVVEEKNGKQNVTDINFNGIVKDTDFTFKNKSSVSPIKNVGPRKRFLLATKDVFDGDCIADDVEPLSNQEVPNINAMNEVSENIGTEKNPKITEVSNVLVHESNITSPIPNKNMLADPNRMVSNTSDENNQEKNKVEAVEVPEKCELNKDTVKVDANNVQQCNTNSANVVPSTSTKENPKFDYNALKPYRHCCPISFNKFRKYSNIDKLVEEFCKNKNYDARHKTIILNRSYLLFYLAPEHRNIAPIDKIQLSDNCPLAIKEIFFNIPKNLYLKENDVQKEAKILEKQLEGEKQSNNKVNEETIEVTSSGLNTDSQQTETITNNEEKPATSTHKAVRAAKSVKFDDRHNKNISPKETISAAIPQKSKNPVIEKKNNNIQQQEAAAAIVHQKVTAASKTVTFDIHKQIDEPTQQLQLPKSNVNTELSPPMQKSLENKGFKHKAIDQTTSPQVELLQQQEYHGEDTTNNKKHVSSSLNSPSDTIIKLPVTLNEFKKYTHYEEIIETLFKLISQNDEELFSKYKNSKKAFNDILMKYYKAFYLLPAIREFWPIRLKPLPSFMKTRLLQIPEGVIMAPLDKMTVKQIILSDINVSDVTDQESSPLPQKTVENQPMETATSEEAKNNPLPASQSDVSMASTQIEHNTESSDSNKCMKRISNEDAESPSSKRQKIEQNPNNENKLYKELLPYANCCPISFSDFAKYSNVKQLFTSFCQKRYNSLKKLPLMLKRAYILYYLAPKYRHLSPLNNFKVLDTCPANLREKFCQIPTNFLKEGNKNLTTQEKILAESQIGIKNRQEANVINENVQKNISQQQVNTLQKPIIEILENLLLPPITQANSGQFNKDRYLCSDNSCLFNHITYADIEKHTNILTVQTETLEINALQIIFKKLLYKIVKEQSCDDKFLISPTLTIKIFKHKIICNKCEIDAESLPNLAATTLSCSVTESDKTSNTSIETVIENCNYNNERMLITPNTVAVQDQAAQKIAEDQRKKTDSDATAEILVKDTESTANITSTETRVTNTEVPMEIAAIQMQPMNTEISTIENSAKPGTSAEKRKKTDSDATAEILVKDTESTANITSTETRVTNTEVPMEIAAIQMQTMNTEIYKISTIENSAKPGTSAEKRSSLKKSETQSAKTNTKITTIGVWSDKLFSKICQKLLAKLEKTTNASVIFSSEMYKMFLECNEIPLVQLLMDTFGNNEVNVQRILNKSEAVEALQRHYYIKHLTNADFAKKYPVKCLKKDLNENTTQLPEEIERTHQNLNSSNSESSMSTSITIHDEKNDETVKDVSLIQAKSIGNNSALEKAKRIFFRNVDKTHTLAYVLRTTFGYKQYILRSVLNFTFDEFVELTSVYDGKELYDDKHIAECMYRYVFRTPLVWPTNLFITLENLCRYLRKRNIHFDNYSTMLFYVSPKLLHWSNLLSCTNILDCVKMDYEKRTGKLLDDDILKLKQECIEYYNRCWKHEKWLADTPLLEEEFCKKIQAEDNEDDVAMVEESPAEGYYEYQTEVANNPEEAVQLQASDCAPDIIVLSPSQINRTVVDEHDTNEFDCVYLPNTQQQIEMLPAEQTIPNDPLNSRNSPLNLNVMEASPESSDEIDAIGELVQTVKTEPVNKKLLSNLLFYEDNNDDMQCVTCEEEVVDLDATLQSQIAVENLPSSQIDFDHLINSEDLHSLLAQHCPNTAEANTMQISQNVLTQLMQLPDISLLSSGGTVNINENMSGANVQNRQGLEPVISEILQNSSEGSYTVHRNNPPFQEAQRFPSTFDEIQISSGSSDKPHQQQQVKKPIRNVIDSKLRDSGEGIEPSTSKTSCKSSYRTYARKTGQPKSVEVTNSKASAKTKNNVATVKPLQNIKNSILVPQIQHNKPPLQTVPAHSVSNSNNNQAQTTESQIIAPTSVMIGLTPTSSSQSSSGHSSQNSGIQLQLPQYGTHIFISQEFNKNCSVFDNSSLLRIVDHNYNKESTTNSTQTGYEHLPHISGENQATTDREVSIQSNTACPDNNSLPNDESSKNNDNSNVCPTHKIIQKYSQNLLSCSQPNSSSLYKETNDKVNDATPTNTHNLLTSITITIKQTLPVPLRAAVHQPEQMLHKVCLYRQIAKFHYFKELTTQHMSKYLLPNLPIAKTYSEALVFCENFKTRISNRSISALLPYWPSNLQRDFLLVLDDLKEFHYNVFERKRMQKQEDFRARVLFWLLDTAPPFSLCQFVYEKNNSEFSHCEPIKSANNPSYQRKPFKCLTNALSPKILKKLEEIKGVSNEK